MFFSKNGHKWKVPKQSSLSPFISDSAVIQLLSCQLTYIHLLHFHHRLSIVRFVDEISAIFIVIHLKLTAMTVVSSFFSWGLCMFIVHKPLVIQGKLMGHQHARQAGNGSVSSVFRFIMICALCCISISNWGIIITGEFLLANHLGQHVWCKESGG